jgi:hypothetical protein
LRRVERPILNFHRISKNLEKKTKTKEFFRQEKQKDRMFARTNVLLNSAVRQGGRQQQKRLGSQWTNAPQTQPSSIWKNVSLALGLPLAALCVYIVASTEHDHKDVPAYSYIRIRKKSFPWGDEGLLESKHGDGHH